MKKNMAALLVIAVIMFLLPGATVAFAPHDAGMAICFGLFFGLNPLCSLYVGIFSGMKVKQRWYLPMVNAAAFLLGVWTVFDWGNPDFYGFAIAYLAVSLIAMPVTAFVIRKIRREMEK